MKLSFNKRLEQKCKQKNNYLCIGLDIDGDRFLKNKDVSLDGMEKFAIEVINGTIDFCPVYKPNFAFFERYGSKGYALLEKLVDYINGRAIVIADAKRGDIGNTSKCYAESILKTMGCDAITVSPYMGRDAIKPFIDYSDKGVFVLAVTSNPGALEIQGHGDNIYPLYKKVIQMASELNSFNNVGIVFGATQSSFIEEISKYSKGLSWLIPGIGNQGGDIEKVLRVSKEHGIGIINVSRGILYSGDGSINAVIQSAKDYTEKIRSLACETIGY